VEDTARSGQQWASELSASVEESGKLTSEILVSSEQRTVQQAKDATEACAVVVQEQKAQVRDRRKRPRDNEAAKRKKKSKMKTAF
jgi:hypothetical protein